MYLHLGQSVMVPETELVGLFDLDNTTQSFLTREFLERAERGGRVESITEDIPKTFAVCGRGKEDPKIYLSQLATATLLKRAESRSFE
ncbi:MAG: DUF370 domain-containing protein [Pseudoflavonifractor sp.]